MQAQAPPSSRSEPPPWAEPDRLAALLRYGILDTPPEPDFDHVTRVAALVCRAPIAVVNLIADTRQFFKSEVGLGVRETPLDTSFCAKAILQPGLTVVPDAREDPRFESNPLVTGEPGLRFYAGALLETPEGLPIGTVCVLDTEPRPDGLTGDQREILLALARQVMTHLELRRALEAQELLSRELSHRIQNVFTVVSGLVGLSARGRGEAAQGFAREFRDRVHALAQANRYVRPQIGGERVSPDRHSVKGLLHTIFAPYERAGAPPRVRMQGEDAALGPTSATALALVLHEVATNAVKYGALSTEDGSVDLRLERLGENVSLIWAESGGPPVSGPPDRQGFGSVITDRSVTAQLGGSITHDWAPAGVSIRLTVPASQLAR